MLASTLGNIMGPGTPSLLYFLSLLPSLAFASYLSHCTTGLAALLSALKVEFSEKFRLDAYTAPAYLCAVIIFVYIVLVIVSLQPPPAIVRYAIFIFACNNFLCWLVSLLFVSFRFVSFFSHSMFVGEEMMDEDNGEDGGDRDEESVTTPFLKPGNDITSLLLSLPPSSLWSLSFLSSRTFLLSPSLLSLSHLPPSYCSPLPLSLTFLYPQPHRNVAHVQLSFWACSLVA